MGQIAPKFVNSSAAEMNWQTNRRKSRARTTCSGVPIKVAEDYGTPRRCRAVRRRRIVRQGLERQHIVLHRRLAPLQGQRQERKLVPAAIPEWLAITSRALRAGLKFVKWRINGGWQKDSADSAGTSGSWARSCHRAG